MSSLDQEVKEWMESRGYRLPSGANRWFVKEHVAGHYGLNSTIDRDHAKEDYIAHKKALLEERVHWLDTLADRNPDMELRLVDEPEYDRYISVGTVRDYWRAKLKDLEGYEQQNN
ncbi:hypothetical protein FWH13_03020 [Candidatus Saccharibacteria bacterium]|nr:hypothetical protein [Candidatus Saccharibacteria bacterium]